MYYYDTVTHISSSVKHCDCSCIQNLFKSECSIRARWLICYEMLFQYNQLTYELKCVIQKNYIKYVLWIVALPHVGKVINELSANHNLLSYYA